MFAAFRSKVPEPIRFTTSSFIGSVAFWALNELTVAMLPAACPSPITVAWFLSYLVSIWLQHWLIATLVYGWTTAYWPGLVATYTGYSGALVVSVPINAGLVQYLDFTASMAWVGTLCITGIANYFLLGWLLGGSKEKDSI